MVLRKLNACAHNDSVTTKKLDTVTYRPTNNDRKISTTNVDYRPIYSSHIYTLLMVSIQTFSVERQCVSVFRWQKWQQRRPSRRLRYRHCHLVDRCLCASLPCCQVVARVAAVQWRSRLIYDARRAPALQSAPLFTQHSINVRQQLSVICTDKRREPHPRLSP